MLGDRSIVDEYMQQSVNLVLVKKHPKGIQENYIYIHAL